jgi:hypothetical protein
MVFLHRRLQQDHPEQSKQGQSGSKPVQLHYTPNRREKDTPDNLQN